MVFTGVYEHSIDAKNRLAVPSEVRKLLRKQQGGDDVEEISLYATLDRGKEALHLWPADVFEAQASRLRQSQRKASQTLAYERMYFAMAAQVEMDRQGRIRLPDKLLRMANLGNEVSVVGANDHLEVWKRQKWEEHEARMLSDNPWVLMHPFEAMQAEDAASDADVRGRVERN